MASALSADLDWWRANRDAPDRGAAAALLERLRAWKAQHDQDRAHQPPPFLRMAWDAIFGDEDARVAEAIAQIEAALAAPQRPA
jgi:hypothetical protein